MLRHLQSHRRPLTGPVQIWYFKFVYQMSPFLGWTSSLTILTSVSSWYMFCGLYAPGLTAVGWDQYPPSCRAWSRALVSMAAGCWLSFTPHWSSKLPEVFLATGETSSSPGIKTCPRDIFRLITRNGCVKRAYTLKTSMMFKGSIYFWKMD